MSKKQMGSSIDDFLKAEGIFEEASRGDQGSRRMAVGRSDEAAEDF